MLDLILVVSAIGGLLGTAALARLCDRLSR